MAKKAKRKLCNNKLSYKGHTADALALRVEEGRGKLRKDMGSRKQALNHVSPNGETHWKSSSSIRKEDKPGELKHLSSRRKSNQTRFP